MPPLLIEGYTIEELLALPDEVLSEYIFTENPLVFRIGSAEILGSFKIAGSRLIIELAQIDGGGEGVLPTLWILAKRSALQRELQQVEWIVHAINCAKPNLKLRRLLERRGFVVEEVAGAGLAYHFIDDLRKTG